MWKWTVARKWTVLLHPYCTNPYLNCTSTLNIILTLISPWLVTDIQNLSPTHFVSKIRHHHGLTVRSFWTVYFHPWSPYFRPSGFFFFGPFTFSLLDRPVRSFWTVHFEHFGPSTFIFHDVQFSSFGPSSLNWTHSDHLIYKENRNPLYMTVHSLSDRPVEFQWTVNFDARPSTLDSLWCIVQLLFQPHQVTSHIIVLSSTEFFNFQWPF